MIRVALDAMGGDHAPQAEIEGALAALATLPGDFTIQLVGRVDVIEAELARHPGADRSRLECIEAPDVIGMAEKPIAAIRKKPKSSLDGRPRPAEGRASPTRSSPPATPAPSLAAATVLLGLHDGRHARHRRHAVSHRRRPGRRARRRRQRRLLRRASWSGFAYLGTVYARDVLGQAVAGGRPAQHRRGGREGHRDGEGGPPAPQAAARPQLRRQHRGPRHRRRAREARPHRRRGRATASSATSCSSSTSRWRA